MLFFVKVSFSGFNSLLITPVFYFYFSLIIPPEGIEWKLVILICRSGCKGLGLETPCQCLGLGLGLESFSKVLITRLVLTV